MKLEKSWVDYLKAQPESGMGHHKVLVKFDSGKIIEGTVTNGEDLDIPENVLGAISNIQVIKEGR